MSFCSTYISAALAASVNPAATTTSVGVTDHGALTGLLDDDHTQYHNNARGDARYYTKAILNSTAAGEGAGTIGIEDAGGHYAGTTVEEALQEIAGGGVTDHGTLTGLADDDHPQYHNNTRGDARYYTKAILNSTAAGDGAGTIGIEDAGSKYTATTVEGALQEIILLPAGSNKRTLRHDGTNWVTNSHLRADGAQVLVNTPAFFGSDPQVVIRQNPASTNPNNCGLAIEYSNESASIKGSGLTVYHSSSGPGFNFPAAVYVGSDGIPAIGAASNSGWVVQAKTAASGLFIGEADSATTTDEMLKLYDATTTIADPSFLVSVGGGIRSAALATGGVDEMVVADTNGNLSTQPIPGGGSGLTNFGVAEVSVGTNTVITPASGYNVYNANYEVTGTVQFTLDDTNLVAGSDAIVTIVLKVAQDATGGRAVTLATSGAGTLNLPSGLSPTNTTTGSAVDIYIIQWLGGTIQEFFLVNFIPDVQ